MKKLTIMVLLAALYASGAACTATSIEEDDYDNGIQLIDKENYQNPTTKYDKKDN